MVLHRVTSPDTLPVIANRASHALVNLSSRFPNKVQEGGILRVRDMGALVKEHSSRLMGVGMTSGVPFGFEHTDLRDFRRKSQASQPGSENDHPAALWLTHRWFPRQTIGCSGTNSQSHLGPAPAV